MSGIDAKYIALGGASGFLGAPETVETTCPDGVGHYRHYKDGSIYWHPLTGAHEVHGLIRAKWAALGWERSILGYPKTDETACGGGAPGRYNLFQGGAVIWKQGASAAFETHGAIRNKSGEMGFEVGFLGFPLTDETKTPDGVGRFSHFEGGSVYWKPSISAHEVHGLIRAKWAELGWERNAELGYPISDELPTYASSKHRCADFENGVLYWKFGAAKADVLGKFTIGNASKSVADVMAQLNAVIVPKLQSDSRVYIRSGPSFNGVTDYSWDGSQVRNRKYNVHVGVGIDVSGVPDPTTDIDLVISVNFDRLQGKVWAALESAHLHTNVPWPTSWGVSASTINNQFLAVLNPLVGVHMDEKTMPAGFHLISVKVMPSGDLNVYAQPLLDG